MGKSTCLVLREIRESLALGGGGVCVPHDKVQSFGVEFDSKLNRQKAWKRIEAKVRQRLGLWNMHCLSVEEERCTWHS